MVQPRHQLRFISWKNVQPSIITTSTVLRTTQTQKLCQNVEQKLFSLSFACQVKRELRYAIREGVAGAGKGVGN
jgi:hypothetical protein